MPKRTWGNRVDLNRVTGGKMGNPLDLASKGKPCRPRPRNILRQGGKSNLVDLGRVLEGTWGNRVDLNRVTGGKRGDPLDLASKGGNLVDLNRVTGGKTGNPEDLSRRNW